MSRALSVDLRVRVLGAVLAGATHREAADRFGVSAASVSRWRKLEPTKVRPWTDDYVNLFGALVRQMQYAVR